MFEQTAALVLVVVLVDVLAVEVEVEGEVMLYMMKSNMTAATKTRRTR